MESALTHAYSIKIQNFEGPFDLLFHLIEKNQMSIYDIPINEITDQYMEYLFAMQEMNLEIASEFLVMAATLLHIKSRMLLPDRKEKNEEEAVDPREELVVRLLEYKKFKQYAQIFREREKAWEGVCYKLPEVLNLKPEARPLSLSPLELQQTYLALVRKTLKRVNKNAASMTQILQHEKVSLRSKIQEIVHALKGKATVLFSDLFPMRKKSRIEVVTGFLAILELTRMKRVRVDQQKQFSDITITRLEEMQNELEEDEIAADP